MLSLKPQDLKPLLESESGTHLTAYLVNRGDLIDLQYQLKIVINKAYDCLQAVMPLDIRKQFLEPLEALIHDDQTLLSMEGNLGIFRSSDFFRLVNIPIPVQESVSIATSFHVKPLLRWLQSNQEFLILDVKMESAHLYYASQDTFISVGPTSFSKLKKYIQDLPAKEHKLFLAGDKDHLTIWQDLVPCLQNVEVIQVPTVPSPNPPTAFELCEEIRKVLKQDSLKRLNKSLLKFRCADASHRIQKNIFQIAKAAVKGKVRRLVVTDELNIFGTIDRRSGGLALHPFDLDHEDDCILDDLAQLVLSQGGEVIIADRNQIPNGRPILAILDDEESPEEKKMIAELQERFG